MSPSEAIGSQVYGLPETEEVSISILYTLLL